MREGSDGNRRTRRTRRHSLSAISACSALIAFMALVGAHMTAQSRPLVHPAAAALYDRLLRQIEKIKTFDHHAHPGFADDQDLDPAPVPEGHEPLRLTPDNLDWTAAARAMNTPPLPPPSRHSRARFNAILDRLGIETSVANRIEMADYLDPARFKWVFYVDSFMFPFDNSGLASRNGDEAAFMPLQTKMLQRFEKQAGLQGLPATLDEYLAFMTRTLDRHQRRGAIAVKFEAAYFRSLVFDDPPRETAAAIYSRFRASGVPQQDEYKTFQDFMFRQLVVAAGRVHLPVHIHSSVGAGDYFSVSGVNVLNLESVLRDPRYARTIFVLIHGGYPFDREAIWLAARKNVYLESSGTGSFMLYPDALKNVLRNWLEIYPDKITFGSDAFPLDDKKGAEAMYWFGVHNGRAALAAALAEMIAAREISEKTALRYAHAYLHDTAAALYSAPAKPATR